MSDEFMDEFGNALEMINHCAIHEVIFLADECPKCSLTDRARRCKLCSDVLPPSKVCDTCGHINSHLQS